MDKTILIKQLNERILEYSRTIEINCIEYASFIVEVGALTVTTDETGKIAPQNTLYPTQFSENAVREIINLNWRDGNNEKITPKVFPRKQWYSTKIKQLEDVLTLLQEKE